MINTEIKIHQFVDSGGGYYVDFNLDLYENEPIQVSKSINDINDISAVKSDHTLTIKLPGSNTNNKAFSNIFKIDWSLYNGSSTENYLTQFNPTLNTNVTLYCNGVVQLKGYLQLLKINVLDEQKIEYECIIIGRVANLFSDISARYLSDLDLGNHIYNKANIEASWVATVGTGYVYPMIDYAQISDEKDWYVENFYPAVYVKQIIDSIFLDAGFRYSSDFFDSTLFKRLIIPYAGKEFRMSEYDVTDRTFYNDRTSDSSSIYVPNFNGDINNLITIPFNHQSIVANPDGWDTVTGKYTIQVERNGRYTFGADFQCVISNPNAFQCAIGDVVFDIRKNGQTVGAWAYAQSGVSFIAASGTRTLNGTITAPNVYCNEGDIIELTVRMYNPDLLPMVVKSGSRFYCKPSAQYSEGQTVYVSQTLPSDIKQSDFLSSIFKLFNLYVEQDSLDDKKLIIEPRDDFYTSGVIDISTKIDVNSPVISEPLGGLKYKSYNYAFKEDSDLKNKQHQDKYKDTYGVRKFNIINDFVKDDYTTDVLFSPTPLSDRFGVNSRIISRIWFNDPNVKSDQQSTSNIRILYWGGMVTPNAPVVDWTLSERSGASTTYQDYPYAGHLNSVDTPTFDLNWGAPIELQYLADSYTDNNLFNLYHKSEVIEISDPSSRLVTFNVWLNDTDRNQLSFRNTYKIQSQYYRLYNVSYDATSTALATIQFLKLKNAPAFTGSTYTINGGTTGTGQQGDGDPIFHIPSGRNDNAIDNGSDGLVSGEGNQVQADKVIVNSQNTVINGEYVNVLGGGGNSAPQNGVALVNCSGYTSTVENEAAVNNIQQPFYHAVNLTVYDVSGIHTTPLEIMEAKYGYWTEVVDSYITIYYNGASVTEFASQALNLQFTSDTYDLCTFDNGITASSVGAKQRGIIVADRLFSEDGISIAAAGSLGSTATAIIKIEIFYRLHKKLE